MVAHVEDGEDVIFGKNVMSGPRVLSVCHLNLFKLHLEALADVRSSLLLEVSLALLRQRRLDQFVVLGDEAILVAVVLQLRGAR